MAVTTKDLVWTHRHLDVKVTRFPAILARRPLALNANGRTFRVRGRGVPRSDGSRGDLLATVEIAVPESLDDDARHVVERLRDSLPQATPRPWEVK